MAEIEEPTTSNPEELVTEDLVKTALKTDKGEDAELLSFEIKPFTKKGDNYNCFVTSIWVTYRDNGTTNEVSYVAKLNPLRPDSSYTEILEGMMGIETDVYLSIIDSMNKELEKLSFPPIKTPKLFAHCLEKGKEAILIEDLREEGFIMYDRTKGMDMNHVELVLEELGRFHASSFLFEQTLHPKTIPESFENFKDVWSKDLENFKLFESLMVTQTENACKFLKQAGPKYECCEKWLYDHRNEMATLFVDGFKSIKLVEILAHADFWTNNMLFKYDESNMPVDLRVVDLQCARKASPAADLIFFFYSSLNGDLRRENRDEMTSLYYDSFMRVINGAEEKPPFSLEELQEEMGGKKIFALSCIILVLPVILAEGDEIWDLTQYTEDQMEDFTKKQTEQFEQLSQKDAFKDRFLAVLDEMIDNDFFDND